MTGFVEVSDTFFDTKQAEYCCDEIFAASFRNFDSVHFDKCIKHLHKVGKCHFPCKFLYRCLVRCFCNINGVGNSIFCRLTVVVEESPDEIQSLLCIFERYGTFNVAIFKYDGKMIFRQNECGSYFIWGMMPVKEYGNYLGKLSIFLGSIMDTAFFQFYYEIMLYQ